MSVLQNNNAKTHVFFIFRCVFVYFGVGFCDECGVCMLQQNSAKNTRMFLHMLMCLDYFGVGLCYEFGVCCNKTSRNNERSSSGF